MIPTGQLAVASVAMQLAGQSLQARRRLSQYFYHGFLLFLQAFYLGQLSILYNKIRFSIGVCCVAGGSLRTSPFTDINSALQRSSKAARCDLQGRVLLAQRIEVGRRSYAAGAGLQQHLRLPACLMPLLSVQGCRFAADLL